MMPTLAPALAARAGTAAARSTGMAAWALLTGLVLVIGLAPGPVAGQGSDRTAFRAWALATGIAPDHAALTGTAATLRDAVVAACAGETDLAGTRAAFHATADAHQRVQWITFGPAFLFDRRFRISFWPDETNALSRQLAESLTERRPDLLTVDGVAGTSAALQGLPALERLLFAPETYGTAPGSYACGLAEAIAGNVVAVAGALEADWQRADVMPGARPGDFLQSTVMGFNTQLQAIADRKLARVLGAAPAEARPRRGEAWRSGRSFRNIAINLTVMADLTGDGTGGDGLAAMLIAAGAAEAATALHTALADALGRAQALSGTPITAIRQDAQIWAEAQSLAEAVVTARRILVERVAPPLGVTIGFNSMDGD